MLQPHDYQFLDLPQYQNGPADSRFHVIPAPLEKTVSYGSGTARGPTAILRASAQVEDFDGEGIPARCGIFTHAEVDCHAVPVQEGLDRIGTVVGRVLALGQLPVILGGEHTVSLGAVDALLHAGRNFGVVQFDAHADLRDEYDANPLSHACVMRRIIDRGVPVFQIGVRSLSLEEDQFRRAGSIGFLDAVTIGEGKIAEPLLPPDFPETIYLSFDLDAFDASLMPATGTPEPGGLFWHDAHRLVRMVLADRCVAGMDVVELAPLPGQHAADFVAAKWVYTLMGCAAGANGW